MLVPVSVKMVLKPLARFHPFHCGGWTGEAPPHSGAYQYRCRAKISACNNKELLVGCKSPKIETVRSASLSLASLNRCAACEWAIPGP
jgi:hypothetical protein